MKGLQERPILRLTDVSKSFGGLVAVNHLSFEVSDGMILGLIGPNGAGKTTVFNLISGISPPTSGSIEFRGEDITQWRSYRIAQAGLARTFQEIHLFKGLSVLENVKAAGYLRNYYSLGEALFWMGRVRKAEKELEERALALLDRFNLSKYAHAQAEELPYGMQKRLEIVKALITEPRVILLDEPAAGLNPDETLELMTLIKEMRTEYKLTILVIEHDMSVIQGVSDKVIVINFGQKLVEGCWEEINCHEEVIRCYLGEG